MSKLKLKSSIKKLIKSISLIIVILIIAFCVIVGYEVVTEINEEEKLKQEIINYSNKDLYNDEYKIVVKTKGDCAYVEEALKKYYQSLSNELKKLKTYLESETFQNLLTANSLQNDMPSYTNSHKIVNESRKEILKVYDNIKKLITEKTIKSLLDKEKLDDPEYYYDLYLGLIYTKEDKKRYKEINEEIEERQKQYNNYFNQVDKMLLFLENNAENLSYNNNLIYFNNQNLVDEWNIMIEELRNTIDNITIKKEGQEESKEEPNQI